MVKYGIQRDIVNKKEIYQLSGAHLACLEQDIDNITPDFKKGVKNPDIIQSFFILDDTQKIV